MWQHQGRAHATIGAHRPKQVGPLVAEVLWRRRPRALVAPDIGKRSLLAAVSSVTCARPSWCQISIGVPASFTGSGTAAVTRALNAL